MMYKITLESMEFRACHGCYDLEKVVGNRFVVDVSLEAELDDAAKADDVSRTVNYLSVYGVVAECMRQTSDILENVVLRIVDAIHDQFPQVAHACVTVAKLAPPLGGKVGRVSVTLCK